MDLIAGYGSDDEGSGSKPLSLPRVNAAPEVCVAGLTQVTAPVGSGGQIVSLVVPSAVIAQPHGASLQF